MRRDTDRLDAIADALTIILEKHRQDDKSHRADYNRLYERHDRCIALLSEVIKANPQYRPDEDMLDRLCDFIITDEHFPTG